MTIFPQGRQKTSELLPTLPLRCADIRSVLPVWWKEWNWKEWNWNEWMNHQNKVKRVSSPSITVDRKEFFSDRFYLNDPTGFSYLRSGSDTDHGGWWWSCQHEKRRGAIVFVILVARDRTLQIPRMISTPVWSNKTDFQSCLDLKAAIVGAYTHFPRFL